MENILCLIILGSVLYPLWIATAMLRLEYLDRKRSMKESTPNRSFTILDEANIENAAKGIFEMSLNCSFEEPNEKKEGQQGAVLSKQDL